ncbi:MAG: septum formation protein Maf [Flavobacteriia bacterium]|nr:MAG: septum formation protein Maf [Flavobacteriia bacterium]
MLQRKFQDKRLILASGSPRRHELLKGMDIPFTVKTIEVEEQYPGYLTKEAITDYLSQLKADAFKQLDANDIVITADTIVWSEGTALTKPIDADNAVKTLQKLSGRKHEVYTSVCVKSPDKQVVFSDCTSVYFKVFDPDEVSYYVSVYKPFDKAGAYGVQEWLGYIGIERLEGSYYNVVGLPVHKLYQVLKDF